MYKLIAIVSFVGLCTAVPNLGNIVDNLDNIYNEKIVEGVVVNRQSKGMRWSNLNELWVCGSDVKCWVEKGEVLLEQKRNQLLGKKLITCFLSQYLTCFLQLFLVLYS